MPIGFGAMRLGLEGRPSAVESVRTLHAAFDAGLQLVDTAINYCNDPSEYGYDEALVARALREWPGESSEIAVVCKGGNLRSDTESFIQNASPENLRWSCETSLKALEVDQLWLYLLHAVDPKVPFEESVGALLELQSEGKVAHIGLSNIGRKQLVVAQGLMTVASVQNELSLWNRASLPLALMCAEAGIAFHAWGPLGSRGQDLEDPILKTVARRHDASTAQIALAWVLAQTTTTIPIPGGRRVESVQNSAAAASIELTPQDLDELDSIHA
jgi:aryl-alcohol dehydrogenase-like predicted oxidoreductase